MMSFRAPTLRHIVPGASPYLRASQRRWARVHDVRFVATQQSQRILDKYRDKLADKAQKEGLRDITELREVYKEKIEDLKKQATVSIPTVTPPPTPPPTYNSPFPPPPPPPAPTPTAADSTSKTSPSTGIKTLSAFLDVDKVRGLSHKDIEAVWRRCHINDPQSLCAAIPLNVYKTIESNAKKHPHFILPLPREDGPTEIHFLQWTFPAPDIVTVIFTHLAEYKLRGEYSQPHTTVTHHLDLMHGKELVLLQGTVVKGRGVSVDEAKWLLMCLQKFYGLGGEKSERKRLLELFGKGDPEFRLEKLVEEAEKAV